MSDEKKSRPDDKDSESEEIKIEKIENPHWSQELRLDGSWLIAGLCGGGTTDAGTSGGSGSK